MNEMKKEIKKEQEIENKIKKEHEMEREIERTVSDSRVETVHMVRPNHMNAAGRLFGGQLMQWLDEVAGLVAKRHIRGNVITASVDNLRLVHIREKWLSSLEKQPMSEILLWKCGWILMWSIFQTECVIQLIELILQW